MNARLFHVFRNTPSGRETLLQSVHFCSRIKASPIVYLPRFTKFLMYFENDVVQVDLDASYLTAPDTAERHATDLLIRNGMTPEFFEPKNFTASTLPDIPTHFDFMCCPRSIRDLSSKIGFGYIGPRVRRIVNEAPFPVLLTRPVFKPWESIAVLFGGSANAVNALKLGLRLHRLSGLPLTIFTRKEGKSEEEYRSMVHGQDLRKRLDLHAERWCFFDDGPFEENLYAVPHDALVVAGAFGHGLVKDMIFGSMIEKIDSILPNTLLIVGPKYASAL